MESTIDRVAPIREERNLISSGCLIGERRKRPEANDKHRLVKSRGEKIKLKTTNNNALKYTNKLQVVANQPSHRMKQIQMKISSRWEAPARLPIGPLALLMIITSAKLLLLVLLLLSASNAPGAEAVDCFKCSSRNGSNPACEDPFHNMNTSRIISPVLPDPPPAVIYHAPCYAGKKGREGLFPASACIKLTGTFARMSHCGKFQFEGDLLKGCVLACPEDACNGFPKKRAPTASALIALISCFILAVSSYKFSLF